MCNLQCNCVVILRQYVLYRNILVLLLEEFLGAAIPDKRLRVSHLHGQQTEGRDPGGAFAFMGAV